MTTHKVTVTGGKDKVRTFDVPARRVPEFITRMREIVKEEGVMLTYTVTSDRRGVIETGIMVGA